MHRLAARSCASSSTIRRAMPAPSSASCRLSATIVPRIEITEPGTLTFMARGPSRYFGGDVAMAATVASLATEPAGLTSGGSFGLGIADGRFAAGVAARRAARTGEPVVIAAGQQAAAEFLAPLPVRLLTVVAGVPPSSCSYSVGWVCTISGRLQRFRWLDVAARFGPLGTFSHRIASGGDDRLPGTHDPPAGMAVQRVFEQPVHHSDVLVFVARQLAEELVGQLAADGRVCTRLVVTAETEHSETSERTWYRSSGLSAAAMVERVRWQVEAWAQQETLTAGVTLLRLDPVEVRSDDGVQLGLWGGRTQADEWAVRAVARMVAVAGEQQVLVPAMQGGRHPHETFTWVPAVSADLARTSERLSGGPTAPWPGRLPTPSPAIVHANPQAITVTDATGAAVRVTGRGFVSAPPATLQSKALHSETCTGVGRSVAGRGTMVGSHSFAPYGALPGADLLLEGCCCW